MRGRSELAHTGASPSSAVRPEVLSCNQRLASVGWPQVAFHDPIQGVVLERLAEVEVGVWGATERKTYVRVGT